MKAQIKDGQLVITLPFDEAGQPSSSGKTTVHASTRGNQPTTVQVDGKTLIVGVNAYTSKK